MKKQSFALSLFVLFSICFQTGCETEEQVLPIDDATLPFNERVEGTFSGDVLYDGTAFDEPELSYTVKVVEAVAESEEDILIDGRLFELQSVDYPDHDFVRFVHNVESPAYATFTFSTAALKFAWETGAQSSQGTLYLR